MIRAAGKSIAAGELDAGERMLRDALARLPAARDQHFLRTTLAQLATYRGRPAEAWASLDAAEELMAGLTAAERLPFHDVRGLLALDLGQLDLAAIDFAVRSAAIGDATARYHDTMLAFACEDFDRAERTARALLAERPAQIDAGELEVLAAAAHWRRAPESEDHRAEARRGTERAVAVTQQPMVRCFSHLVQAQLDLAADDVAAAEAAIARAEAVGEGSRGADAGPLLAVLRARIALHRTGAGRGPNEVAAIDAAATRAPGDPRTDTVDALAAHRDALRAQLRADLDTWRALAARPGGLGFLQHAARRDTIATAIAVERRLRPEDPAAGFDLLLELDAVHTLARRLEAPAATLADVQAQLVPQDGVLLCVLPAWHGSWAFVVSPTSVQAHELRGLDAVHALARRMRADLADTDPATRAERTARLAADGRAAADRLLPAALRARVFASHHLVFVGAGLLDGLPLEALPGPDGGWLGVERAISYLPSFAVGLALVRRLAALPDERVDLALFAASVPGTAGTGQGPDAFDLGGAPAEWSRRVAVASTFAGEHATREAFRDLPPAALLCAIGHGVAADAAPGDDRRAALAIAGETTPNLRCRDVESAAHAAGCVMLAACGGARGPQRRGDDDSSHLAGAFLAGGAAAVIAAEPDVELQPTLAATGRVLDALLAGAGPAEALRAARAAALAEVDADPSHALALRVHGIGHLRLGLRPGEPTDLPATVLWLGGAALIALIALAVRRRSN